MIINKEYSELFNAITDSMGVIDDAHEHIKYAEKQILKFKEMLKNAQINAEESYIAD